MIEFGPIKFKYVEKFTFGLEMRVWDDKEKSLSAKNCDCLKTNI